MIKRLTGCLIILSIILVALPLAAQSTGVTAEAVGQANLRAAPDVNSTLVGEIQSGTSYPVIGRSEFYPWLLLGDPASSAPIGWVFAELVTPQGNINTLPYSTVVVDDSPAPTATQQAAVAPTTASQVVGVVLPSPTATLMANVVGVVSGEINIRFGPGADYPRIGIGRAGDRFEITAYHTQLPWLQIRYPDAPNGMGWVAQELLEVEGDVFSLPAISQTIFNLPTLTPTPSILQNSVLLGATPIPLSPAFEALGNQIWNMILAAGFEPETSRKGALFLKDLQTGEAVTFNNDVAFSGMSITKIAILTELYNVLNAPPDNAEAITIANAMVCSQNTSTNDMLRIIGGGDPFVGAADTTHFLSQLGLNRTFIVAPFVIDPNNPLVPTQPIALPQTDADQTSAFPDPSNQMTVDEIGWLLSGIYQCAYGTGGPLVERFGSAMTPNECGQILQIMSGNTIGELIEAGVPAGTRVAHKHGWINDTHGDAGVVFTPGGDYVLVMTLYNPTWLDFSESFPLMAEISRTVYNYYNPDAPMAEVERKEVPAECNLLGNPLIEELMSGTFSE
jgi:uncharacterized protein YraI/beta-lactamase class A